jgi:hypothetical protein
MAEYKQTVTKAQQDGVTEDGSEVVSQTKRVQTETAPDSRVMVTNVVWFLVGLFEIILGLRFALKMLGANPAAGFVSFIYSVSGFLSAPFDNIFGVRATATQQGVLVFEPSILVAMLVYLLIGWGIVKLLNLNHTNTTV